MSTLPLIASLGAGRMGRGISLAFAYGGYDVDLIDLKARTAGEWARLAEEAREDMASTLSMLAELGAIEPDAVSRLFERIIDEARRLERLADQIRAIESEERGE